jgi:hypothetical protein
MGSPDEDIHRADRDRIRRAHLDDLVALTRRRKTTDQHRRAADCNDTTGVRL